MPQKEIEGMSDAKSDLIGGKKAAASSSSSAAASKGRGGGGKAGGNANIWQDRDIRFDLEAA